MKQFQNFAFDKNPFLKMLESSIFVLPLIRSLLSRNNNNKIMFQLLWYPGLK